MPGALAWNIPQMGEGMASLACETSHIQGSSSDVRLHLPIIPRMFGSVVSGVCYPVYTALGAWILQPETVVIAII